MWKNVAILYNILSSDIDTCFNSLNSSRDLKLLGHISVHSFPECVSLKGDVNTAGLSEPVSVH